VEEPPETETVDETATEIGTETTGIIDLTETTTEDTTVTITRMTGVDIPIATETLTEDGTEREEETATEIVKQVEMVDEPTGLHLVSPLMSAAVGRRNDPPRHRQPVARIPQLKYLH